MTEPTPVSGSTPAKDWLIPVTYIIPIVFIYTMMKKGSDANYVWHAKNGAGIVVFAIALNILFRILLGVLGNSLGFLLVIFNLLNLAFLILIIYGAWQAWQGKLPTLPLITKIGQMLPLEKWFHGSAAPTSVAPAASPAPAPQAEPVAQVAPAPVAPTEPSPAPVTPVEPSAPAAPSEPTPPTPPAAPQA